MSRTWVCVLLVLVLVSCGVTRHVDYRVNTPCGKVDSLIKSSKRYLGVPYKYGGISLSGFDCSGLLVTVFKENNIFLPRRSEEQAKIGKKVEKRNVQKGDLVFFATAKGRKVSHVGMVCEISRLGEIRFIHSSTKRGVVISSVSEPYWKKAYLFARRIL
ncbi:MAG: NlpC/P60 family protein [Bergeyella sp.]|nr:NlpC/P60 family protein [Bergeyella sp.]